MTEQIQILNDKGNPTGEYIDRSEAHKQEKWHRAAHVWIVNSDNELLLQKRSDQKSAYAGVWHISVAGHITGDDTALATAVREVQEEIGLDVDEESLIELGVFKTEQRIPETGKMDREFITLYLLRADVDIDNLNLQDDEVAATELMPLDEFLREIQDESTRGNYLNHPPGYYEGVIKKINAIIEQ